MATKKKPKSLAELGPVSDPQATLDSALFLKAAGPVLKALGADLLERADASPGVTRALHARHQAEKAGERTADGYPVWRRNFVEQVADAWLLSVVFVRTLEDRGLLATARIAGPGAEDSQRLFFDLAPSLTERDYLLMVFKELSRFPAAAALFDADHNPVWKLAPSAAAAKQLLQLFRLPDAATPAFRFGQPDTRFLGDLYQDLDENVRKRFALLQTPHFVESFILDRTLEPAIERFGLAEATLIDPTCGSGHFLLGAFDRLYDHQLREHPGLNNQEAAHSALDAIAGSDINPYAIAIARFRLTLAYLEKTDFNTIGDAPELPLHLATADSLLHNPQLKQGKLSDLEAQDSRAWLGEEFALEDEAAARDVLHKTYAAVVGNPPYITVKDKVLRDRYRDMYSAAFREYSLGVPFTQRFFQLARDRGSVGMITANSFMKREFGRKLIGEYLPTVNLTEIVNTSGAYIPGHGTPTVLLFGTHEAPVAPDVLAVLAKRGEPSTPEDPEQGLVWSSIVEHGKVLDFDNDYITVAQLGRNKLVKHPWSLAGGGADELKTLLEERAAGTLRDHVAEIGFGCMTRADDIYFAPRHALRNAGISDKHVIENVEGEFVRDWSISAPRTVVFPYDDDLEPVAQDEAPAVHHFLWPYRTLLWLRREPNGNHRELERTWWEWSRFQRARYRNPLSITFAFVATHNHFVLDRGGKVFKQTAPIIKLPEGTSEDDHLALLAYLNSSTACFWMKQVFYPKGGDQMGDGGRLSATSWEDRYEFAGTGLKQLPLPPLGTLLPLGRELDALARERAECAPASCFETGWPPGTLQSIIQERSARHAALQKEMLRLQERIDWEVYRLFGLYDGPEVRCSFGIGERAVERRLLTREGGSGADADWFRRAGLNDTEVDHIEHMPLESAVADCIATTEVSKKLKLLETIDYKRWWKLIDYDAEATRAATETLLDRIEQRAKSDPQPQSARMLLTTPKSETEESELSALLSADSNPDELAPLISAGAVPFLAACRYSGAGLERFRVWEGTWALQRREDAGEEVGEIPVPPKYGQKDFLKASYWKLRGKLDVPKERFISYPGCESDEDGEPVYGWAGWDHLQRAQALAGLYQKRKTEEDWPAERLTPMLAGLQELIPWLKQWHNAPSDDFGGLCLGDYFEDYLATECSQHGLTPEDLLNWRPAEKKRGKAPAKAPAKATH